MNDGNNTISNRQHELEPQLQAAVLAVVSEPIPNDSVDRVRVQAIGLNGPTSRIVGMSRSLGIGYHWAKVGALAACLFIVFGLLSMYPDRDAFAQVVANVRKLSTAKFIVEIRGFDNMIAAASVKAPDRLRLDFEGPGNPVNVTNGRKGEMFSYDAKSKQVTVYEIPESEVTFDILKLLQQPDVKAVVSKSENTIAGTQLYDIFGGSGKLWIDIESKLPKRLEVTPPLRKKHVAMKVVYRDFVWDEPLDDNLFEMPVGKTVVRSSLLARPTEDELVAAFTIRQSFSQEPYESSFLEDSTKPGLKLGQLAYDLNKGQTENYQLQVEKLNGVWALVGISQLEATDPVVVQKRIDFICMKLDQWATTINRSGGWVGGGVRPGEAKPLCWWKEKGKIRVLRADLTIVDASEPPGKN